MKPTNQMIFIIHTDNLDEMQENALGIHSVWKNEEKAQKECDELNEKAGEEVYTVEPFPIMK
ncbi:hypothetical protein Q7A53_05745 [Halobacillus rhizosphaerae]|uniref:hypothetical protein n=1 Tax=Halobacillus rhizosphaerae TaxID=3064889 RepID=UPI00398A8941